MKAFGDIEVVNLSTGETWQRVTGDGESVLRSSRATRFHELRALLDRARKAVQPIIDDEAENERRAGELLDFRLD